MEKSRAGGPFVSWVLACNLSQVRKDIERHTNLCGKREWQRTSSAAQDLQSFQMISWK